MVRYGDRGRQSHLTMSDISSPSDLVCVRHCSCFLNHAYPAYHTFKVLQSGNENAQNKWITFWFEEQTGWELAE